jgi:hypothetical protein
VELVAALRCFLSYGSALPAKVALVAEAIWVAPTKSAWSKRSYGWRKKERADRITALLYMSGHARVAQINNDH